MKTEAEIKQALQIIIDNREAKALNYAINYAIAGLHLTGKALKIQVLYVLNNIAHWRGREATHCRQILKAF